MRIKFSGLTYVNKLKRNLEACCIKYTSWGTRTGKEYYLEFEIPDGIDTIYTSSGERIVARYIEELKAKRKEILDAGKDNAEATKLPDKEEILEDIMFTGIDDHGEYYNGWAVTDHYDSDYPLLLKLGRDFLLKNA